MQNNTILDIETQKLIKTHMKILNEFKSMYEKKQFQKYLFDTEHGYLQTVLGELDDKMPLDFFVEYNNCWWFPMLEKVVVPSIGYNYENNTGTIVLEIHYQHNEKRFLHGTQYIEFNGEKISYLRTYASPTFFTHSDNTLIKLDNYGNIIWLASGYDMVYSAKAALEFFKSPKGRFFAAHHETKAIVATIIKNIENFLKQGKIS